ncbi:tripartite tricarboxylate transporter substrate binding protein [Xylophilus sp. GOD-11R]|uniref:Bug family tripartite tricarboxylate transporter substrate binding protein n=1 Tax=Xylophilus sp. GOD-11R TaxID=3089814 RepID=UPI00298D0A29|nr:tripartite tricarboxylate transporter substrate binding protein [Xylophilus sp. GOD-11R]WPB56312.1 tripartite tricarboxylate transporter substrate binding protein [Xylophilus sp. GOD-11R]
MKFIRYLLAGLLMACSLAASAESGAYPRKPITLVIPFPVTGAVDVLGRHLADKMATLLDQTINVENRPGAGATLAATHVAAAAPDGYTLMFGGTASHVSAPVLYRRLPYDPVKSFVPIGMVSDSPHLLALGANTRATNLRDLIAELKAKGANARLGSSGAGTMSHLAGEQFKRTFGLNAMVHVPSEGGARAAKALVAGEVDMAIINFPDAIPLVKTGRLRVLATTGAQRSPVFPNLPTVNEANLDPYVVTTWVGLYAPARTPAPVVKLLTETLARALEDESLQRKMRAQGDEPTFLAPKPFAEFVQDQSVVWQKLIREAQITVE